MKKILFVCLGNICRSPAAEGVMTALLEKEGMADAVWCDSAGTAGYHVGERADARMRQSASRRGYDLTSRSRQFDPKTDFEKFDFILAMDDSNYRDLLMMDRHRRYRDKVLKMTAFCEKHTHTYVPDPYYGGDQGFETVLDILEDACEGLLKKVKAS